MNDGRADRTSEMRLGATALHPYRNGFGDWRGGRVERANGFAEAMVAAGQMEATSRDFLTHLGRTGVTAKQVGTALGLLGVRSKRIRIDGARLRAYDLTALKLQVELDPPTGRTPESTRSSINPDR